MTTRPHNTLLALMLALSLLLTACKVEVYQGITESQANEMLSVLLKNGISAEKKSVGKTGFTLKVSEDSLTRTLDILREHNLPREPYQNLGTVFAGQGMISSPTEEQARMAHALSQELADTFSRIDGVLSSRVHVVLSAADPALETHTPPSAAVFLRHTPESVAVNMVPKIRELAASAVPGLSYDKVTVMLVPMRESVSVPRQKDTNFPYVFGGLLAAALLVGVGLYRMSMELFRNARAKAEQRQHTQRQTTTSYSSQTGKPFTPNDVTPTATNNHKSVPAAAASASEDNNG